MTTRRERVFSSILQDLTVLEADHPKLHTAVDDLNHIAPWFGAAVQRLMDARPALPGAQSFSGTSGGNQELTTVERLADQEDRTQHDRDELDRLLRRLDFGGKLHGHEPAVCRDAHRLRLLITSWTPRPPSAKQKAAVERANNAEPECDHCRRLGKRHEPYRTVTDVGGILPEPVPLCRWHADFTRRNGRAASETETDRHHQGRTIRLPA